MERKMFKILEQKEDCVLLKKDMPLESAHSTKYFVRDIENDIIYSGYDYHEAMQIFEDYDINEVRRIRKEGFENWLSDFAEPKAKE